MNIRKIRTAAVFGLFVFLGSLLAGQATEVKIKVIVENASIRVKPGIDGTVLEDKIPVGAVYLSSKKEGEWYEVRFRSKLGLTLTGYIHEMYVEVVKDEAEQAGKQPPIFSGLGPARIQAMKTFEIGLTFGLSAGSFLTSSSTYSDTWSWSELESVSEAGTIPHQLGNPFALGFSLTYYFRENVGFRLSVDYNLKQTLPADGQSLYQLDWTWTLGRGSFHDEEGWPVKGDLWLIPISANLIYKIPTGGIFAPYFTAGMTAYLGKANIETSLGYANSWISSDGTQQLIDLFIIPVKLEKDLTTAGVNVGAGLDVLLSPNIAFNIDAVYYWGSSYNDDWPVVEGTYPASYYTGTTLTIDWMQASDFKAKISKIGIKLSSFRIAGGLKILF
jgi:opacity protein-like surface antigen